MDFTGSWDDHLPPIEFSYNNSYHSTIQMAPYEALYGPKCRSLIRWFEIGETKLVGSELVQQAIEKIKLIRERLLAAKSYQKSYAYNRRRDLEFQVDDWVFLKVSPIKGKLVTKQLSYEETPIPILDRQIQRLRTKDLSSVKVFGINNNVEDMTWEAEEEIKTRYPHLFPLLEKEQTEAS
ncbi:uncharacterized protein [Nicotiana tomentosiformis]|uniref:uncharacterized protein n=1 Tax=Nicotiana tomentosiformis TaxID=4098 RepID=UPI00388CAE63